MTRIRFYLISGALWGLIFAVFPAAGPTGFPEEPPDRGVKNVLFIILDALRADHLGIYGYPRNTSPNIDRLARKGIVFGRAIVQAGWTRSSIPSYFTSTYPAIHGAYSRLDTLHPGLPTMAEIFRRNGYTAYGFHNNDMIHTSFGFDRGFDVYQKASDSEIINHTGFALAGGYIDGTMLKAEEIDQLTRFLETAEKAGLNLVRDYSFEGDNRSWSWQREWLEEDELHSGKRALHIAKGAPLTPDNFWYPYQPIKLDHGRYYLFGAFVKTRGLSSGLKVRLREMDNDSECTTRSIQGDNDWTLLMGVFTPGGHDDSYQSEVRISPARLVDFQEGEFWIDDVFLIPFDYFPPLVSREEESDFVDYLQRAGTGNRVSDGSFESNPSIWQGGAITSAPGHHSPRSLGFEQATGLNREVYQDVDLRPGTPYLFGAFAYTRDLHPGLAVEVEINGARFRTAELEGDNNWTLLQGAFRTPGLTEDGDTVRARIFPAQTGDPRSGEFRVDNVFLLPLLDADRESFLRPTDRLFFYLHFIDPHVPYAPPETYLGHFRRKETSLRYESIPLSRRRLVDEDRYDAEISGIDDRLGLLMEKLEEDGILDETLVVITADHGEGFGEHGIWGHKADGYYDECIRVPLILYNPRLFPEPARIKETIQASVDALPSLIDLLKLTLPPGVNFQGSSVFSENRDHLAFFYDHYGPRKVTDNRWSYISNLYSLPIGEKEIQLTFRGAKGLELAVTTSGSERKVRYSSEKDLLNSALLKSFTPEERDIIKRCLQAAWGKEARLYDITRDPGERKNIIADHPDKADEFIEIIRKRLSADRVFRGKMNVTPGEKAKVSSSMKKRLRELGYFN